MHNIALNVFLVSLLTFILTGAFLYLVGMTTRKDGGILWQGNTWVRIGLYFAACDCPVSMIVAIVSLALYLFK